MPTIINSTIFKRADASTNSTVSYTIPTGGQSGDVLYACLASSDALDPSSLTATGWTIHTQNYTTAGGPVSPHMALMSRLWDGATDGSFTIGADNRDDQGTIILVRGADTTNPVGAISASYTATNSTGYTASGVNTTLPSSILASFCAAKNGAASYADDTNVPSGMTALHNRRSRVASTSIRTGVAYENIAVAGSTGTRAWSGFSDAVQYTAAFNFVINPSPTLESIISVNGGAGITAGSTGNTAQLSGYSSSPTSATIGPLSMTNLSYNSGSQVLTFDCPAYADGATWPLFDSTATFTVSNGSQSANLNSTPTNPPTGWATVTISGPNTTDSTYIGFYTDISNHEMVYETKIGESVLYPAVGLVITTDGGVSLPSDLAGDHIMYKRNLTSGVITQLTVAINDASEVVSVSGLTSIGLTSIGLTSTGLTSAGL